MIEAYHMIGLSNLDQGRELHEQYHEEIIVHVRERYQQIVQDGCLYPAQNADLFEKIGHAFALDHLAGDNQYVFLSVGKRYWNLLEASNFGFVFDAEQLVEQGAILRSRDLLQDYQDLHEEVTIHFIPYSDPKDWTEEQRIALFQSIEGEDTGVVFPTNDAYYALQDAIEHGKIDHPQAREATELLRRRMREVQESVQCSGDAALHLLRSGKAQGYEMLVPDCLSLDLAIAHIVGGIREKQTGDIS